MVGFAHLSTQLHLFERLLCTRHSWSVIIILSFQNFSVQFSFFSKAVNFLKKLIPGKWHLFQFLIFFQFGFGQQRVNQGDLNQFCDDCIEGEDCHGTTACIALGHPFKVFFSHLGWMQILEEIT